MLSDEALHRLDEHQHRIRDVLARVDTLLALPADAARDGLAQTRWQLLRLLREYQLFKHGEIFDPAIASPEPLRSATATDLKRSCLAAGEAYTRFTLQWASQGAGGDWAGYAAAKRAMRAAIGGHLVQERRMVASLLAGTERTRPPDTAP